MATRKQATRKSVELSSTVINAPVEETKDVIIATDATLDDAAIADSDDGSHRAPGKDHNKPDILDDRIIRQYALHAFADFDDSKIKAGSAVQRLAAAIIAQHEAWVVNGHPDEAVERIPSLEQCVAIKGRPASKDNQSELIALLRAKFIDEVGADLDPDEKAAAMLKRGAHNTLLNRALRMAGYLAVNGHNNASFNSQMGNFTVAKDLILPPGHAWSGFMARKDAPSTVLLDGRVYSAESFSEKTKKYLPARIAASVENFIKSSTPVKPGTTTPATEQRTPNAGQGKVSPVETMEQIPHATTPGSLVWALEELHLILCGSEGDEKDMDATGAFTSEQWTKLTDIAQWSQDAQAKPGFVKDALDRELASKKA